MRDRRNTLSPGMALRASVCVCVCVSLLLSGCGAWQTVSDTSSSAYRAVFYKQVKTLNVDLTARASLNPDDAGRPTSVAIRIYQLKDRKQFDGASYADLLKSDRTVLAQELQGSMSSVINPDASASLSQAMRPDTEYVAIAAFFRETGNDNGWKYVIEKKKLDADKPLKLVLVEQSIIPAGEVSRNVDARSR